MVCVYMVSYLHDFLLFLGRVCIQYNNMYTVMWSIEKTKQSKPTYEAIHHPYAQPFLVQINPMIEHSSEPVMFRSYLDPNIARVPRNGLRCPSLRVKTKNRIMVATESNKDESESDPIVLKGPNFQIQCFYNGTSGALWKTRQTKTAVSQFFKYYAPSRVAPCRRACPGLSEYV